MNTITVPVTVRRRVSLTITFIAFLAIALAALPSAADAENFRFELKPIKATNGYKVSIAGDDRYAAVSFERRNGQEMASYQPYKSRNSKKKVTVKLGSVGSVKLKFTKVGKKKDIPLPSRCSGKPGTSQPVRLLYGRERHLRAGVAVRDPA